MIKSFQENVYIGILFEKHQWLNQIPPPGSNKTMK